MRSEEDLKIGPVSEIHRCPVVTPSACPAPTTRALPWHGLILGCSKVARLGITAKHATGRTDQCEHSVLTPRVGESERQGGGGCGLRDVSSSATACELDKYYGGGASFTSWLRAEINNKEQREMTNWLLL
jgi:hypothetical protein